MTFSGVKPITLKGVEGSFFPVSFNFEEPTAGGTSLASERERERERAGGRQGEGGRDLRRERAGGRSGEGGTERGREGERERQRI